MIRFDAPQNLNGQELREELRAAGVAIENGMGQVVLSGQDLHLNINPSDAETAKIIVQNHNGTLSNEGGN